MTNIDSIVPQIDITIFDKWFEFQRYTVGFRVVNTPCSLAGRITILVKPKAPKLFFCRNLLQNSQLSK